MPVNTPKNATKLLHTILMLFTAVVFLVCMVLDSYLIIEPLSNEPIVELDQGWIISVDGKKIGYSITLPYSVKSPVKERIITATSLLPAEFPNHNTCLMIESGMSSVEVAVDGQILYVFDATESPWRIPVYGGGTAHFIRLPDWTRGKQLTLNMMYSTDNAFAGHIGVPRLGTKTSLLLCKSEDWPALVFGYSFLLIGGICVLVSIGLNKGKDRDSLWYFGWVELALGSWVFTQSSSHLLIIRNPATPMNLSLAALFLLPYFLSRFVCTSYPVKKPALLFCKISAFFPIAYVTFGILQLFGILLYTDVLLVSAIALAVYLLAFLLIVLVDFLLGNKQLWSFLLAMTVLFITIGMETLLLFFGIVLGNALLLYIGITIAGVILFWHSASIIMKNSKSRYKEQMLLEIAYSDSLTGLKNRSAYESKINDITHKRVKVRTIGILVMDINDLKTINDTLGHMEGDRVLQEFAKNVTKLLPQSAEVFRIGGDEFVCFLYKTSQTHVRKLTDFLEGSLKTQQISVAIGYAFYIAGKAEKFTDAIHRADSEMYRSKARMKMVPGTNLTAK